MLEQIFFTIDEVHLLRVFVCGDRYRRSQVNSYKSEFNYLGVAIFDLMKDPLYEDRVRLSIELTQFVVVVELRCLHVARKLPSFLNVFSSQRNFD